MIVFFFYLGGTEFDSLPVNGLSWGCLDVLSPCRVGLSRADRQASHLLSYALTSHHYSVRVKVGFRETVEPTTVHFGVPFVSSSCGIFIFVFHLTVPFIKKKVKFSRYRPGVAQRVGRGIALLFHDRGTRRGWVVSSTPWPHFTTGKDPVPILQEAGWAPGPVWTGGKSRPHPDSIPGRPARNQSLYRLSYRAHNSSFYTVEK